jgi:hypothetical protein
MSDQVVGVAPRTASPVRPWYVVAAVLALVMMVLAIQYGSDWLLNFLHVMTGALWTGIDLFMGFVVEPVLKRLPLDARRAVISGLVPRTLFLMPTVSIITSTTGWFLAKRMGFLDVGYPEFHWVIAALVIVTIADESAPLFRAAEAEPGQRQHDDVGVLLDRPRFVLRTNGR